MKLTISNNDVKEVIIGVLALIILGLVFMLAFTIYVIETNYSPPARMFPTIIVSELWQAGDKK